MTDEIPRNNAPSARRVRGRPFEKGNPGRRRGSRNKVAREVEELIRANSKAIASKLVERALDGRGNTTAGIALLRTIHGQARERPQPIEFDMPPLKTAKDAMAALAAITAGVANGEIDPDSAKVLTGLVSEFRQTLVAVEQEERLQALESQTSTKTGNRP